MIKYWILQGIAILTGIVAVVIALHSGEPYYVPEAFTMIPLAFVLAVLGAIYGYFLLHSIKKTRFSDSEVWAIGMVSYIILGFIFYVGFTVS